MAVLELIHKLPSGQEITLGYVCQYPSGEYWFNPRMPHRRSSRKAYDSPEACIPRWAKKQADEIREVQ